ncbi:MAG TPA: 23S rRNA (uracil(1939)-C(5))-methyltransferase RlmD [Vicinamibacterales bacterium]|nr:23S rRNA (uracil(1939)-C(5))-methyltransferase RlmD [Vicinamibacterales bacterium]
MNCKHFGVCGGCTLPGVPYAEQLAKKRAFLSRLLGIDVPPVLPSPKESGFRNKVSFVFATAGRDRTVMGHFAQGSQRVIPIDECPVHHERGNRIAFKLRDQLVKLRFQPGVLRHIIVRTTDDGREASAMLVVSENTKALRIPVKKLLASDAKPDGFFVNINHKPGPYMVGDETLKIEGRSHVKETIGDVSYLVSPTAFFQTNAGAAALLVKLVLEEVGDSKRVLDLYCGSGLFALQIAKAGATVTAVEENRQAIADAESNVRLNRLSPTQIRFVPARVEDALGRVGKDPWDAVVLDPPRQGCPLPVINSVFEDIRPARVVYVSCNPDALASELPVILKMGYRVTRVQPVDMFPHTDHIETVVAFARA